jgi:toxin HigB-1
MINSFKHKGLKTFFYTGKKKGVQPEHVDEIAGILDRLNAASAIMDIHYPGSYLHKLSGNLKDQFSVRVSGNWRILLRSIDSDAYIFNYDDYH